MTRFSGFALTRRGTLACLGAFAGLGPLSAAAEPPPETTRIRLLFDPAVPILCVAPTYLAPDFLRLEGFTDIAYVGFGGADAESAVIDAGRVDIATGLSTDFVRAIDAGRALSVIGGLHAGCVEVFANDSVGSIRGLRGKRIPINFDGGPEHIFIAMIVAWVGLDPKRDIDWVIEPDYLRWPGLFAEGKVDVVYGFPPFSHILRDLGKGHVILNTTLDDPWRNIFCCLIAANRDFAARNPVATKRALRAFYRANMLCDADRPGSARRLVEFGVTANYDHALRTLDEVAYGAWRDFSPEDSLRFAALRLREVGLVRLGPNEILARGADFRFLDELRREMKL